MALEWITEPSDYSGAVGSTMPVVGSVSNPTYNGTPINFGTFVSQVGSVVTNQTNVGFTHTVTGTDYARAVSEPHAWKSSNFSYSFTMDYSAGTTQSSYSLLAYSDADVFLGYLAELLVDSSGHKIKLWTGTLIDVSATFYSSVDVELSLTNGLLRCIVSVAGNILKDVSTSISLPPQLKLVMWNIGIATVTTMSNLITDIYLGFANCNLKDNLGVSRLTRVSTDGSFNEVIPDMQTVDTGTWALEAESGGETIVSEFNVNVDALEWVHEPTNPNNVSIGGALNVGAEVSISSGVGWTLSLNGEVVNEVLDSTGLYSFSSVVNPAYGSSGWLLTASCCGDIVSSAFSVVVSTSNSIKDTYKSGEVFDFEGTPLNGVTRLVSSFIITGQGENVIQDVYASSDNIQDVYNV